MAEGGAFPSLSDGSDAYVEQYCTPCGEDNIKEEAVKYCPECDEHLCTRCTRQHTRRNATKSHKLVDRKDAKQSVHVAKTKCIYHLDRDIEMYCGTHDMVYCLLCIATDHRNCEQVDKIEGNVTRKVDQREITSLFDEITNAKGSLNDMKTKQTKNLSSLEEKVNSIHDQLEDTEERMIKHIRKLKNEAKNSVNEMYDVMKEEIKSEISIASRTVDTLNESSQKMQFIDSYNTEQKFMYLKLTKKAIADANTVHVQNISRGTTSIIFTERPELEEFIKTVDTLGQVSKTVESQRPKQYKVKSTKEINIKHLNDKSSSTISDVCQLHDGRILVTDVANNNVKLLDQNYNIIDRCELDAIPTGICCSSKNEVAVKTSNNQVQFISVTSSMSKTRCISIEGGGFWGMTFYNDRLWVSAGTAGINIYTTKGRLEKSVVKQNGKKVFKSYVQHMAVSGDTVIVTDHADGAVCLNKDGTIMRELRDSRLVTTLGVCVDDDGTVFLCGRDSNNILMFNKDGKCEGELVEKDLCCPYSMCYDRNKNSLIVVSYTSNIMKILELKN